jgi:hypothetical protein
VLTETAVVSGVNPEIPDTNTGEELLVVELFPSWPEKFAPQHWTVPSAITAHEWEPPVLTLTAVVSGDSPVMPHTGTGTELFVVELLPNWPTSFLPQHRALPLAITAHES